MKKVDISTDLTPKEMLMNSPSLYYVKDSIVELCEKDCQMLYMYPLNILDYYLAYMDNSLCRLVVKNFNKDKLASVNKQLPRFKDGRYRKCIDLEITNEIVVDDQIEEFITKVCNKGIQIGLNIKGGNVINIDKVIGRLAYIKFNIYSVDEFNRSNKQILDLLASKKEDNQVVICKIYLNLKDISKYSDLFKFCTTVCDYILLSKQLIPIGKDNIKLPQDIAEHLINLKRVCETKTCRIKLVKDLSTLYYPLFTKDERNTSKCYAYKVCNYLIDDEIYPCASRQILNDKVVLNDKTEAYIRDHCSDCASLFENDLLEKMISINATEFKFLDDK